ncbi:hypothetical protein [Tenacibaculum halocynthiae]|uniref:hypothetical protein n=1 Tax=Tenacibaculum halocynthiae TaxID=1254437 RepID=UPI0038961E4C
MDLKETNKNLTPKQENFLNVLNLYLKRQREVQFFDIYQGDKQEITNWFLRDKLFRTNYLKRIGLDKNGRDFLTETIESLDQFNIRMAIKSLKLLDRQKNLLLDIL